MKPLPIACTLTAGELQVRREGLRRIANDASAIEPIDAGYRLTFTPAASTLIRLVEVIEAERRCCRFLTFELIVAPDAGPITLTLTGPPGTREFLGPLLSEEPVP